MRRKGGREKWIDGWIEEERSGSKEGKKQTREIKDEGRNSGCGDASTVTGKDAARKQRCIREDVVEKREQEAR